MQKKRKKSRNRTCILLRLFEIVSLLFSQWTQNLQGGVPACVRQTTLFEQVETKNEDFIGSRYLRSITSIWWTPLWVVKDDLWSKSEHLPYISPIVDHTFVWGRGGGVKCHMKVLSFVRDVRTFEMTPKYGVAYSYSHILLVQILRKYGERKTMLLFFSISP